MNVRAPRRPRRTLGIFALISCALHALVIFCVPIGPAGETMGQRVIREVKVGGIEFIKTIRPKPKPTPKPRIVKQSRSLPRVRHKRTVRRVVRRVRRPVSHSKPLEAQILPPPKPEERAGPPPVEEVISEPQPAPTEEAKTPPTAEPAPELQAAPEAPEPERLAMAPQPIAAEPRPPSAEPLQRPGHAPGAPQEPEVPLIPELGAPEHDRPMPASGGEAKRSPQIGLLTGRENRSALPGTADRVGEQEQLAGPGGPIPRTVSPNPGGSSQDLRMAMVLPGPSDKMAVRPGTEAFGPPSFGTPSRQPGPSGLVEKRSPGSPGVKVGLTTGIGRPGTPSPGSGEQLSAAGPGEPLALMTSPKGVFSVPSQGAEGSDSGVGGGGGAEIVLIGGGGGADFLAAGPDSNRGLARGEKTRPAVASLGDGGGAESRYARGGLSRGVGTGIGDGAGPGDGIGAPLVVLLNGPGGGYGQGGSAVPVGWPSGTTTIGAPGLAWLEPGLGQGGGGGLGLFGGPDQYGMGGGYPGLGGKLTPAIAGLPGGPGPETRLARADGGDGGAAEGPSGPGWYGPLQVGGMPGDGRGGGGLSTLVRSGLGIPLLPSNITRPLVGIHGGFGSPSTAEISAGAVGKQGPGGIYADLVGTFDIPVGVTNSDYNTDEVSVLNLLGTMRERTNVRVTIDNRYVPITYEAIKDAPLLWISGHKPFTWTDQEREALRKYVENGGTLLVEDCHGPFNQVFPSEVRRIFGRELEPIPLDDELFKSFYVMNELPAGDVQERLPIRGLRMPDGRLGVIYSPNDYSDAWKVPRGSYVGDAQKEQAYRMGINMYIYVLAHWRRGQQTSAAPKLPGAP